MLHVTGRLWQELVINVLCTAQQRIQIKTSGVFAMKKWECVVCGFVYDESAGLPDDGIAPGTRWEDIPEDWECPDCGVSKSDFEMIQVDA